MMQKISNFSLIVFMVLTLPLMAATRTYVLCEGNYMTTNASLWVHNGAGLTQVSFTGGILGDTGQSLTRQDDQLYVVCNNSHNIEILDLSADGENKNRTILLANAGPRKIVFDQTSAYVSCWLIPGILVLDREDDHILDTIYTNGKPEDMVIAGNRLFVSLIEESDSYDKSNKVLEIDISDEPVITRMFTVAPGPEHLIYQDSILYVSSTWYDETWNALIGLSRIDLTDGMVLINDLEQTSGYSGSDLVMMDDTLYYAIRNGIYAIDPHTLQPAAEPVIQIDSNLFIYSLAMNDQEIWLGLTDDYVAPDYVCRYSWDGTFLEQNSVGASPGDIAFYPIPDTVGIADIPVPGSFELGSPYPNPFNDQIMIPFRVPDATTISLRIFSINGKVVFEQSVNGVSAGWQIYRWNASNSPTGIYMVSVSDGRSTMNKKIILLK